MMSGTSVDGIDVAIVDITPIDQSHIAREPKADSATPFTDLAERAVTIPDAQAVSINQLFFTTIPWDEGVRRSLFALFHESTTAAALCRSNFCVAEEFAAAAHQAVAAAQIDWHTIDLIASHGQTIWHDVVDGRVTSTLQIGDPSVIAARTGVTTIGNFRTADVAVGGQGAPLVSIYDWVQLRPPATTEGWRAIQNIGGIGNVTFLPPWDNETPPLAFDTGPGNVLMDWAAAQATNHRVQFDVDGQLAAAGTVSATLLAEWLSLPYFTQLPPKTTGRELFDHKLVEQWWTVAQHQGLRAEDFVATLTELTAATIADAYARFAPGPIGEVIVAGGGARNPTLMERLRAQLTERLGKSVLLRTHADLGIDDKAKEGIVFAFIAYQTLHGAAGNVAACTGANRAQILGQIAPGNNFQTLLQQIYSSRQ